MSQANEQKVCTGVDIQEMKCKIIQKIYQLFEQLKLLLINSEMNNKARIPTSIFDDLADIWSSLINLKYQSSVDILDISEILLIYYLELLDTTQFVDIIAHCYAKENIHFIRSIFTSSIPIDSFDVIDKMPLKARQQMYYRLLDHLSASARIVSFLKNSLSNTDDIVQRTIAKSCGSMLIIVLRHFKVLDVRLIGNELEKYQNTLFNPFITFLNEYFMINKCSQNDTLIKEIIDFLWKTSNTTLTIPILINANCPQACLRWLLLPYLNSYQYQCITVILCNIARHDEGAIILNEYDCYNAICQFEVDILYEKIDFIADDEMCRFLSLNNWMTICLIMELDKVQNDFVYRLPVDYLLSATAIALKSTKFYYVTLDISEILIVLMKLCIHDKIIDRLLQNDKFPTYSCILEEFVLYIKDTRNGMAYLESDVLSIIALANIFWSISFHDQYKNELIRNIELVEQLAEFRATGQIDKAVLNIYMPRYMSPLRRAIDGIWQNLYPSPPEKLEIRTSTTDKPVRSLMISYSHVNIEFCRQLYNILNKDPGLSISVDINSCNYLWKETVQVIEQSDLVLCLISKDFFNSKSCRQELSYVKDTMKIPFISVFIDSNYKTTDWLHSQIAESKHVRFGETDFMNTCDELLSMIYETLSIKISSDKKPTETKQWNDQEVKRWFTTNNIILELCEFYRFENGGELLLYAQAILPYPWTKEYGRIKLRFEEKFKDQQESLSSHEFLKFIKALERLKIKTFGLT